MGGLVVHQNKNYHLDCMTRMENFIYVYSKEPETSFQKQLFYVANRIFLNDDGDLVIENDASLANEGNFHALLQYRIASGDAAPKNHLEICSKNATYISKTTQNEVISIIGTLVLKQVIEEVKLAQFYTILLDETRT
ncbi:unnamed protein product [Didymodactylos carnosus]|uniref:DUF4371 domain-containing protein n=1 Tax=Didymodactylos carnosus TaxID=1234261 RepID=A0A816B094_9BILA|nr:unnamed protein product [Didymodactylos carnosus]CAF1603067.1 unnamed protein product [Didymodactylos carnosus]CAF4355316.1 unnamed protein product [Didymodactylos carnosus]CAF4481370.1 unnamed protein product [Didymodactylos carnosus]